ncbi:MAG: fatty acid desaturase [Deltaproteobacteria bacterium]|nr:fatty acid desaturase [Deltaproteobacteria bacterium]
MIATDVRPAYVPDGPLALRVANWLNEPRDVPFVSLIAQCLAWQLVGIFLFFLGPSAWYLAPLYWACWGFGFLDRFILMLHCTSHRALFKDRRLNNIIPWIVGPFYGQTPESYFAHHMGMHHPENNLAADLSSTMRYQRDRFAHWLHYFGSFLLGGIPSVALYHHRKGNTKMLRRFVAGEASFWIGAALLLYVNVHATLIVFVFPVLAVRALMMAGNWGQHAFVDAADPGNPYRNSITCINVRYNHRCFNDGYHILHHIRPRTHYTEYPVEFEANKAEYGRQDAIVFEGIDFFQVWLFLMLGRHDWLARRMVRLPGAPARTDAEAVAFLKQRLAAIPG